MSIPARQAIARQGARVVLAAVAYFGCARLAYQFAIPQGIVLLWPASGLLFAFLALSRKREWPALALGGFIGCMASDTVSGLPIGIAAAAAAANVIESVFAASLLQWRLGDDVRLSSVRAVLTFTLGVAVASNAVTAWIGAWMLHSGFGMSFRRAWFVWWIGDGLGMLLVAPMVFAWRTASESTSSRSRGRVAEGCALLVGLALTARVTLGPDHAWLVNPGPYLVFPFLFWAALRFGMIGSATTSLIVGAVATWNTALGVGPFASADARPLTAALQAYVYLAVTALSALFTAAVLAEREVAGAQLLENKTRYRAVVDGITDAIITTRDGAIEFANDATVRMFGYSVAELAGQDPALIVPGLAAALSNGERLTKNPSSSAWSITLVEGRHKDGHIIPLEASFGAHTMNGRGAVTGVLRDLTERHATEEALRTTEERMRFALETSGVGVWEAELTTGRAQWSATLEILHGLMPGSFGQSFASFMSLIYEEDREAVIAEIERATREHTDANILYRSVWPDGSVHWISGVGRAFYDGAGKPLRSAGIGLDVTERRALEEQYRQSQKMEAIGQLAGGVAHDFNNLLTAIQGYTALAMGDLPVDSPIRADLCEVEGATQRAASLTRQLLAFSRRQVLTPTVMNLGHSLRSIEPILRRLIGETIDVVVTVAPRTGNVKADAHQMEQVILNLALNARDAMPLGGRLVLDVSNVDLNASNERRGDHFHGPCVMLVVSDSGTGMDAATLTRVFEPFFTTKPRDKGTGLGLSTVHGIVNQSGGRVSVDSEVGHGTTFKVYLPRVDVAADAERVVSPVSPRGTGETVLVVEDHSVLRQLADRILVSGGYHVLLAGTPSEAVSIAASHLGHIDVLLTDVGLPEMSGHELATRIYALQPSVRVLYMSGYADDAAFRNGRIERDAQFIQKPFSHAALLSKLRAVIESSAHVRSGGRRHAKTGS